MGVYIKMEMPESCIKCKLCVSYKCVLTGEIRWSDEFDYDSKRFENCPLVPIPPHRRLIDADALYEDCALDNRYEVAATTTRINEYMQLKIDAAPTIIPAEQKGE